MDVKEAIGIRRSVRSYEDREIPEEDLNTILNAARLAPSARNEQSWKFIVVRDKEKREALAEAAANQNFVGEAPVIIVALALNPDYIMRCGVSSYAVNLAIAVDHITLQAVELGLGTCWIGAFYQEDVKKILQIPDEYKVVALLPVGYLVTKVSFKNRKSLDEIVCLEIFK